MRSRRRLALVAAVVFTLVAGCAGGGKPTAADPPAGSAPAPSAPKGPVILTVGHHLDPTTLNPHATTTAAFQSVYAQIHEQLIIFDADKATIKPMLAESWQWVNPTTLEMKLKQGVKFTNGEEFNAEAAKYSVDVLMAAGPYAGYFIKDVYKETQVVDPSTIRIILNQPYSPFLGGLARGSAVVPPKYHKEAGPDKFGQKPVGTGPFMLKDWVKDNEIVLEANPNWWAGKHPIDKVIYKVIPEETARMAAVERGEVDIALNMPVSAVKRFEGNPSVTVIMSQGLRKFGTYFDTKSAKGPLSDPRVRVAMNLAVDKDAIVKSLFQGAADPLPGQLLTATEFGYNPNIKMYDYDPAKAKQLLTEAGYPNGFDFQLTYTVGRYPADKELGEIVASYLEKVGIKVKQRALEYGAFLNVRTEKQLGSHQWGLLLPPDPHFNFNLYVKDTIYEFHRNSDEYNELVLKGVLETDTKKREAIYQRIAEILHADPNMLLLVVPRDIYVVNKRVEGFKGRTDQVLWLYDVKVK